MFRCGDDVPRPTSQLPAFLFDMNVVKKVNRVRPTLASRQRLPES